MIEANKRYLTFDIKLFSSINKVVFIFRPCTKHSALLEKTLQYATHTNIVPKQTYEYIYTLSICKWNSLQIKIVLQCYESDEAHG